jgi:hypothetical protein
MNAYSQCVYENTHANDVDALGYYCQQSSDYKSNDHPSAEPNKLFFHFSKKMYVQLLPFALFCCAIVNANANSNETMLRMKRATKKISGQQKAQNKGEQNKNDLIDVATGLASVTAMLATPATPIGAAAVRFISRPTVHKHSLGNSCKDSTIGSQIRHLWSKEENDKCR